MQYYVYLDVRTCVYIQQQHIPDSEPHTNTLDNKYHILKHIIE